MGTRFSGRISSLCDREALMIAFGIGLIMRTGREFSMDAYRVLVACTERSTDRPNYEK